MVNINKTNSITSLKNYKSEQLANDRTLSRENIFDDFRHKDELRTSLIKEQGYLCAYCMQRIKDNPLKCKIEHCRSQDEFPSEKLDYKNLLLCCKGNEGRNKSMQHCDTKKGSKSFSFNPSVSDNDMETLIKYSSKGKISSSNQVLNDDLNNMLNLNEKMLVKNRESVLIALETVLRKSPGTRTKSEIEKLIRKWSKLTDDKHQSYFGVAVYKLKKHPSY